MNNRRGFALFFLKKKKLTNIKIYVKINYKVNGGVNEKMYTFTLAFHVNVYMGKKCKRIHKIVPRETLKIMYTFTKCFTWNNFFRKKRRGIDYLFLWFYKSNSKIWFISSCKSFCSSLSPYSLSNSQLQFSQQVLAPSQCI